ncbi:MAG: ABC transporter permease [Candidatus Krumholzibacteria bacterium]|nr:ABC transporter permease [Candidatus Krumholzibacteria bacterium]MDH4338015.1 ABC transporter permease [Candidatus Krumholzibacteria bacterium]MDH5270594.1 ABC transporter permease [Candidatus Krumholzibacteria bacterium]
MTALRRLYQLARADFRERVRRYAFLVTMVVAVCLAYAFVPPNPSKYVTLSLDSYRGIYNSAWIGTSLALLCGTFVSMIGFFVVKNAVDRDRRTRVGQIIAATPTSKLQYTLGKTLSNFAVLAAMATVVAVAAIGMQILRAEDRSINMWQLFSPFLLLTFPVLMITAAFAVLFETIPGLRGGPGNVLFVFGWTGLLTVGAFGNPDTSAMHNDILGMGVAWPGMVEACARAFPTFDPASPSMSMGIHIKADGLWVMETFRWDGIHWTGKVIAWRALWVLAGLAVGAVAAIPFDRFDPARARTGSRRRRRRRGRAAADAVAVETQPASATHVHLTPLAGASSAARPGVMIVAEWKLLTRGLRWWYAGPLAVAIMSIFMSVEMLRFPVLPLAFLWPVLLWSRLGSSERVHGTESIFFSAPRPLSRQLPATWIAGIGLGVLMTAPIAIRMQLAGETGALLVWLVGIAFVPSLAMALGVWTGSSKFFEALYTFLWYAMIQRVPSFDFSGCLDAGVESGNAAWYAVLTMILFAAAVLGRRRRLQN